MDLKVASHSNLRTLLEVDAWHTQQMIFIWRGKLKAVLPKVKTVTGLHGYLNGECLAG